MPPEDGWLPYCEVCGALTLHMNMHEAWHKAQDEAREAADQVAASHNTPTEGDE